MKTYRYLIILVTFVVAAVCFYLYTMPFYQSAQKSEDARWITEWDQLDITTVRRDYQPYTVAEKNELWQTQLFEKYGYSEEFVGMMQKIDNVYPQDTYLSKMLELGRPFIDFSDYETALIEQRRWLYSKRLYWDIMNTEQRCDYLLNHGLACNATWEVLEDSILKNDVVNSLNFWYSKEIDPDLKGYSQQTEE